MPLLDVPPNGPRCEVCRLGSARVACWVSHETSFLACVFCAQWLAWGETVRIGLRYAADLPPEPLDRRRVA